jgi:acyl-CoA dehydrogenase
MNAISHARDAAPDDMSAVLLDQADRLFEKNVTKERLTEADRGKWPEPIWQAVEEAGFPLALLSEAQGGYGIRAADALLLIRRAGYHTVPVPLGETMIACALWVAASGEPVSGSISLAPTNAADSARIKSVSRGYHLDGHLRGVPWGARADHVLVYALDEHEHGFLVLVPRSAGKVMPRRNIAYEPRDTLHLDAVALPKSAVRPAPPACASGMMTFGALLRAQQMAGAMQRSLDYALNYSMERKQFGRPIGKFQAIQHMLSDAAGQSAAAAAAADGAAEAWGSPQFGLVTALAKSRIGEAAGKVAAICHQVHGAMGFTHEHPLHFATRRLWSWRDEFGSEAYWEEKIGQQVCARGGESLWDLLVAAADPGQGSH